MNGKRLSFYMACEHIANARGISPDNQIEALERALNVFRDLCSTDAIVLNALHSLQKTPLPDFNNLEVATTHLQKKIEHASINNNPDWLIFNLFLSPNAAAILYNYPGKYEKMMYAILNFARNVVPAIED